MILAVGRGDLVLTPGPPPQSSHGRKQVMSEGKEAQTSTRQAAPATSCGDCKDCGVITAQPSSRPQAAGRIRSPRRPGLDKSRAGQSQRSLPSPSKGTGLPLPPSRGARKDEGKGSHLPPSPTCLLPHRVPPLPPTGPFLPHLPPPLPTRRREKKQIPSGLARALGPTCLRPEVYDAGSNTTPFLVWN